LKHSIQILFIYLTTIISLHAQSSFKIDSFSPEGFIKNPSQVAVRFSEPMIAFGDSRVTKQVFQSNCLSLGTERWLDAKNWVLDFKKKLPGGVECKFVVDTKLTSLNGNKLTGKPNFQFSTGGINILRSQPWSNGTAVEDQAFILVLDGEVNEDSMKKELFFTSSLIPGKVEINTITGKDKENILNASYYNLDEGEYIAVVQPKINFSPDSKIELFWSKEIISKSGIKNNKDQILKFNVRPRFQASFYCERENADKNCIPLTSMELRFSSAISIDFLKEIFLKDKAGKIQKAELLSDSDKNSNTIYSVIFNPPFAEDSEFTLHLPSNLRDDSNRTLGNASNFPLKIKTEKYPPLAKFASGFGILESKSSPILPVTVRNLESKTTGQLFALNMDSFNATNLKKWLSKVNRGKTTESIFKSEAGDIRNLELPKTEPNGRLEVVGIPLIKAGFYAVEIKSRILGKSLLAQDKDFYIPTTALVTNLSVHLKWGRESSLIWVTELNTGKPVDGVEIDIQDCNGKSYIKGKTNAEGVFNTNQMPYRSLVPYCSYRSYDNGLFILAKKDNDASFLHTAWNQGIETWRFNLPSADFPEERIVHTILDRTLFRAGETVSMKHILRKHSSKGFVSANINQLPKFLAIVHDGTEELFSQKINWNYPGSALSQWKIPKTGKLGSYTLYLTNNSKEKWGQYLGRFRVEEFRLPILKASISSPKTILINESKNIPITLQASYLAGGSAGNLPVKFRYRTIPYSYNPQGWDKFSFASTPLKEGRVNYDNEISKQKFTNIELVLDKNGIKDHNIPIDAQNTSTQLQLEMEFMDPNGETQTVASRIQLLPSSNMVGLGNDSYTMSQDDITVRSVVVDNNGKPVPNAFIEIVAYKNENYSHRKRLVGGFYAYDSYQEIKKIGEVCSGKTDDKGYFICKKEKFSDFGDLIFEAKTKDSEGRISYSNINVWVSGKGDWWYAAEDHDRMDIIPEKDDYSVGQKVKLQIKAPFREYTALITVEREGILKSYIRNVDSQNPFVEIPVEKEFVPNAFISVLAVRGRVDSPKETALVDLARPSFRLGITEIKVGWAPHKLNVIVETDKKEYKVRSKATLNIQVTDPKGNPIKTGGEVAIAVVDEALLELAGNPTWDLLSAMMGRRGYELENYSANMQVIGKRHFGRKALPAGGGGGNLPTRELFDTILHWEGKVTLNQDGKASIGFPLKDSLTSYRVVAIATAGLDLFGTGITKFSSTQDLLLFSGLPPIVRSGDSFFQEYTIKNNTKNSKKLSLQLEVDNNKLNSIEMEISPDETKKFGWEQKVGKNIGKRKSILTVFEADKMVDRLQTIQEVKRAVPIRVIQGTLSQVENDYDLKISSPNDSIPGDSSVELFLSSSILNSTETIKTYMLAYPYSCMEQKVSKAIVSDNQQDKNKINEEIGSYLDADGLVKYFPGSNYGDEILTSYILSIAHEANWKLPDFAIDQMVTGLNRYLDGTLVRNRSYYFADSTVRKLSIMESLSRYGQLSENRLSSLLIDVKLLPSTSVLDLVAILKRLPNDTNRSKLLSEAELNLRGRLNIQGREMNLSSTQGSLWWLMGSDDQDSARFLSYALDTKSYTPDLGRMARSFVARMKDGRFSTTLANSYGYLTLKKFANTQEKEVLSGTTVTKLDEMTRKTDWKGNGKEETKLEFSLSDKKIQDLKITHNGQGKPWASIQVSAAIPLAKDWDNGIRIRKNTKSIEKKNLSGSNSVGDIIRVRLDWELSAPRTWVVIDDPIPTGATILGTGLGRDSASSSEGEIQNDFYPAYQERSFSGFRSYYEYLPAGKYSLEYTYRLNTQGKFSLPPTRAEAMYSPDIFGETPNEDWSVLP
jgi:uncharacterized protein YfaS (alpha-2-macroglobulin family)